MSADPEASSTALFVVADEPLLVYRSIRDAELDLEAIDVENGTYPAAYGRAGEPYQVGTDGMNVVITRVDGPNKPEELKPLLARYLKDRGEPVEPDEDVEALAQRALLYDREFWTEHDPFGDRFGKAIPLWGCITVLGAAAVLAYLFLR